MAASDDLRQLSIRTADREVDVTLPAHIPIGELMPAVLDLIGADDFSGRDPRLARVCGEQLDAGATLAQCAIPDGELLILTVAARPGSVPRFDASTAVIDAVADLRPPPRPPGRKAGWIAPCWAAALVAVLLGRALLDPDVTRHTAVGAAAAVLALAGAVAVQRAHRDRAGAAGLGVLAAAFAGLTAALASPGRPGLPGFLLAMSAISSTSLLAWRLLRCAPWVFLPLAAVTMAASATAVGAVAGWWPTTAAGPMLATGSLAALALSARLAVLGSGLSAAGPCDIRLEARARTARRLLSALIVTGAGAAALGAVMTAATTVRPIFAAVFITILAATVILRAHRYNEPSHVAALLISSAIAATSLIALCAAEAPSSTPWLGGGLLSAAAAAVWLGQCGPRRFSPAARRAISVFDLAVSAAVVPSAAAAAGAFAALSAIGLA